MNEFALPINKDEIAAFCKKHHINTLSLFGSILTSQFTSTSDVDVLVNFDKMHIPNLFEVVDMESELSDIIGRPVDLKTPNDLSPFFRDKVVSTARIIYE